jgi:predicted metal-dependent peptidase
VAVDEFSKLRFKLLREHPFFGSLLHKVECEWGNELPFNSVACTNGEVIKFQPEQFAKRSPSDRLFILAHELMHCVFTHPYRAFQYSKDEDRILANMAGDYLINALLKDIGFTMPTDGLYDPKYTPDKYSMEQLVAELRKTVKISKIPSQMMRDLDSPGEQGKKKTKAQMNEEEQVNRSIIKQAVQHAKMAGKGSAMLDRMIDEWDKPKIDWKKELQEFLTKKAKVETSWNRPSRRAASLGLYLPSKGGYKCGHIGVAVDLSGSMGPNEIKEMKSEMKYIFELAHPSKVTVITFDDGIKDEFTFEDFDSMSDGLKFRGGGGTDFRPVFKRFEKLDDAEPIEALVFMTDMCGPFPDKAPPYPVLFLDTHGQTPAPFGRKVVIDKPR